MRAVLGSLCFAMLLSGSAWAASVEPGQGTLTVNQGQGFQAVDGRVDAKVGDSIMVAPGSTATVVYDDGCRVDVQPGVVTTIGPLSPCAANSYAQTGDNDNTGTELGAMVIVGGVAGGLIYEGTQSSNNSSAPASP